MSRSLRINTSKLHLRTSLCLSFFALVSVGSSCPIFAQKTQKSVLVLYSTRRDAAVSMIGDREFPAILTTGLNEGIDYYAEYLDVPRSPDAGYLPGFRDFLRVKYRTQRFDAVIAIMDVAFGFVRQYRNELFPETPVIFLAQNPAVQRLPNSTGFINEPDLTKTVTLALMLQPNTRHAFVVTGASDRDKYYDDLSRKQFRQLGSQLDFTYLSGLTTAELDKRLATLPANSIVYYLIVSADGNGQNFNPLDYLNHVTAVANSPTYSWTESTMNRGIVGGSLRSQRSEINALATLALRVLKGEPAAAIPMPTTDLSSNQVDWRQVRRWSISEARIPADTKILFRDPNAWDQYKVYIVGTFMVLLIESGLIAALLLQAARRKRAERQVAQSQTDLRASYDQIRKMSGLLVKTQEDERSRIARDLHDDVVQRLALLVCELKSLGGSGQAPQNLQLLVKETEDITKDVRNISHQLHPSKLRMLGLIPSLKSLGHEYSASGVVINITSNNMPAQISEDLALCLFRIVQEGVRNAIKHGVARTVSVQLQGTGKTLSLSVADDGVGFDTGTVWRSNGLGFASMRERIEQFGGTLKIESVPGRGTQLQLAVEISEEVNSTPT